MSDRTVGQHGGRPGSWPGPRRSATPLTRCRPRHRAARIELNQSMELIFLKGRARARAGARLLREAHLEQAVRLVQHQRLQVLQADRLRVAQVVDQAPLRAWMYLYSGSAQRVICVARSARARAAHSWPSARHAPGAQVMAAGARAREPLPRGAAPAQAVHRRPSTTVRPRGLSAHQGLGTVHAHPPTHVKPFRACYVPRACAGQRAHRRAGRGWAGPGARRRGDHDLGLRAQRGRLHLQRQAAHHERHAHVRELRQLGRHAVHLRAR